MRAIGWSFFGAGIALSLLAVPTGIALIIAGAIFVAADHLREKL